MPGQEILGAFRHVRNHLEQHDGFVEMIQVIGGEPGAGIDVGGLQLRSPRLHAESVGCGVGRLGGIRVGAAAVICHSVNIWS